MPDERLRELLIDLLRQGRTMTLSAPPGESTEGLFVELERLQHQLGRMLTRHRTERGIEFWLTGTRGEKADGGDAEGPDSLAA